MAVPEFPRCVAMGAVRAPTFRTEITPTTGGAENRNQNWVMARMRFDVSRAIETASLYEMVGDHFYMARGRKKSFVFKDFLDSHCPEAQGSVEYLGAGVFQLFKNYGQGEDIYVRRITRPMPDVTIYLDGVAADFPLDPNTGTFQVSDSPHPAASSLSWSGGFWVPVRYDIDALPAQIPDKEGGEDGELYVSVTGVVLWEVPE